MKNKSNPDIKKLYKKWSLEYELEYLLRMYYEAEYQLWLPRGSIAMEEEFTKEALKFMEWGVKKVSVRIITLKIIRNLQRKKMQYFCDFDDGYEPEVYDKPERENNCYILKIAKKLKEMRWEEFYDQALWYYRTLWDTLGIKKWYNDTERAKISKKVYKHVKSLSNKLKKDIELNNFFSKNLELAKNYDFI